MGRPAGLQWGGSVGAYVNDVIREHPVIGMDDTWIRTLDPGAGKTHLSRLWDYCAADDFYKHLVAIFTELHTGQKDYANLLPKAWAGRLVAKTAKVGGLSWTDTLF